MYFLMKSTFAHQFEFDMPGVNFTNVLWVAFALEDAKRKIIHQSLFSLLGSARIKAACKHVVEIDLWSRLTDPRWHLT